VAEESLAFISDSTFKADALASKEDLKAAAVSSALAFFSATSF
jgi:hypothetical protein